MLSLIALVSKSLLAVERRYNTKEREAIAILHGLEFYHYHFAREVSTVTDHKPLVAIHKKDVATLSQELQHILLRIYQNSISINLQI